MAQALSQGASSRHSFCETHTRLKTCQDAHNSIVNRITLALNTMHCFVPQQISPARTSSPKTHASTDAIIKHNSPFTIHNSQRIAHVTRSHHRNQTMSRTRTSQNPSSSQTTRTATRTLLVRDPTVQQRNNEAHKTNQAPRTKPGKPKRHPCRGLPLFSIGGSHRAQEL